MGMDLNIETRRVMLCFSWLYTGLDFFFQGYLLSAAEGNDKQLREFPIARQKLFLD